MSTLFICGSPHELPVEKAKEGDQDDRNDDVGSIHVLLLRFGFRGGCGFGGIGSSFIGCGDLVQDVLETLLIGLSLMHIGLEEFLLGQIAALLFFDFGDFFLLGGEIFILPLDLASELFLLAEHLLTFSDEGLASFAIGLLLCFAFGLLLLAKFGLDDGGLVRLLARGYFVLKLLLFDLFPVVFFGSLFGREIRLGVPVEYTEYDNADEWD
ncbi:MAG TPA: hypothetical protein VFT72_10610 [Opitutaceae bacterium]|nr:hypothetical protein [Opitutaceae bacterium]